MKGAKMKIDKVETIPFSIPMKRPSRWGAAGIREAAEGILIRVYTSGGIVGQAEAIPRPYIYGDTLFSLKHILDEWLIPGLVGADPFDTERIWESFTRVAWNPSAKAALDMALFDIKAQACQVPVFKFLGGWQPRVPVSYMVSLKPIAEMQAEAEQMAQKGIKTFKLKGGQDLRKDIGMITGLRKALGEEVGLYVDANQGYALSEALRFFKACEEMGILCVEEPVPVFQGSVRQKIARSSSVPIMGDDSCFTLEQVIQEVELEAIGIINIKTSRTGYYVSQKIVQLAEAAGMICAVGSQGATGIGTLTAGHFAAAFPTIKFPSELTTFYKHQDDLLTELPHIVDGFMELSSTPGLGISVDEAKLAKYKIG
jgi:L-alanine-DL-glutamate epimerase-like enolase superfamily enzyme